MNFLQGMGEVYGQQRQHARRNIEDEGAIRTMARMREQDAMYRRKKAEDDSFVEAQKDLGPEFTGFGPAVTMPAMSPGARPAQPASGAGTAATTPPASGARTYEGRPTLASSHTFTGEATTRGTGTGRVEHMPTTEALIAAEHKKLEDLRKARLRASPAARMAGQSVGVLPDIQAQIDAATARIASLQNTAQARRDGAAGRASVVHPSQVAGTQVGGPTDTPTASGGVPTARGKQYDDKKTPYDALIHQAAIDAGLDPVVFRRLIGSESSFNPAAMGPADARGIVRGVGIAQINPTAHRDVTQAQMLDPTFAVPWAAKYFKSWLDKRNGDYAEALYGYKGASTDQGRASMAGPINDILAGTSLRAPAGTAQVNTLANTPGAAAPVQPQPAAPQQFSPEQIAGGQDPGMGMEDQVAQHRVGQLRRMMATATSPAAVSAIRAEHAQLQAQNMKRTVDRLAARASSGDTDALGTLMRATGVRVAQTPAGFVPVDPTGRAAGQPMSVGQLVMAMRAQLSQTAADAAQKAQQELDKMRMQHFFTNYYGAQKDLAVEGAKAQSAAQLKEQESNAALTKALATQGYTVAPGQDALQPNAPRLVTRGGPNGPKLFVYTPGVEHKGVMGAPTFQEVRPQ